MEGKLDKKDLEALIQEALDARTRAHAPYSHYHVGAALMTEDGKIYQGCNIENASYGATNCAERTAFFKAVDAGERKFSAIAIAGGLSGSNPKDFAYPCGICRQVMQEFCKGEFLVIIAKSLTEYQIYTLAEIMPFGFGGESIQ